MFSSSDSSLATTKLNSPDIDPNDPKNKKGPLTIAAAGSYNTGKENSQGRFVVIGSSAWAANSFLNFNGNSDLALNTMNWLSSDEDLISIRPKAPEDRRITMTRAQMNVVRITSQFMSAADRDFCGRVGLVAAPVTQARGVGHLRHVQNADQDSIDEKHRTVDCSRGVGGAHRSSVLVEPSRGVRHEQRPRLRTSPKLVTVNDADVTKIEIDKKGAEQVAARQGQRREVGDHCS